MKRELLRNCSACGKEISRHSPFCRSCGHPQGGALARWIVVGFALLVFAASIAMFFVLQFASWLCK